MHDHVIGWDDELTVDDDQVMADGHADLTRNEQASESTTVSVMGGGPSGDINGDAIPTSSSGSGPGSGDGGVQEDAND